MTFWNVVSVVVLTLVVEFMLLVIAVARSVRNDLKCPTCRTMLRKLKDTEVDNKLPGPDWSVEGYVCPRCGWLRIRAKNEFTSESVQEVINSVEGKVNEATQPRRNGPTQL